MNTATEYAHITLNAEGTPILAGTKTKVVEVILDHLAHAADAPEIHREYPHLSLGQIHSALAYYYDHQEEMDREIQRRREFADELRAKLGTGPVSKRLAAAD